MCLKEKISTPYSDIHYITPANKMFCLWNGTTQYAMECNNVGAADRGFLGLKDYPVEYQLLTTFFMNALTYDVFHSASKLYPVHLPIKRPFCSKLLYTEPLQFCSDKLPDNWNQLSVAEQQKTIQQNGGETYKYTRQENVVPICFTAIIDALQARFTGMYKHFKDRTPLDQEYRYQYPLLSYPTPMSLPIIKLNDTVNKLQFTLLSTVILTAELEFFRQKVKRGYGDRDLFILFDNYSEQDRIKDAITDVPTGQKMLVDAALAFYTTMSIFEWDIDRHARRILGRCDDSFIRHSTIEYCCNKYPIEGNTESTQDNTTKPEDNSGL